GDVFKMDLLFREVRTDFAKKLRELEKELHRDDTIMADFEQFSAYERSHAINQLGIDGARYDQLEREAPARKEELVRVAHERGYKDETDKANLINLFCKKHKVEQKVAEKVYGDIFG